MNFKKILLILLAAFLSLSLNACKKVISFENSYTDFQQSDEQFFGAAELIVRATPKKIVKEYFTNPDGEYYLKAHVTVYELSIAEVYKGILQEDSLEIKIFNGAGMSPELYLYGEDEKHILEERIEPFLLEIGKEYILGLAVRDPEKYNCYNDPGGYGIQYGKTWTFVLNEEGLYENLNTGTNHRIFDIPTLKNKIATVQQ